MDQFVPADWTGNTGDAGFAPPRGEDDGLVELLWCGGHVAMHTQPPPLRTGKAVAMEHEAAPWFQYPVVDEPLEKDLLSEIFSEMRAAAGGGRLAGSGTASALRGGKTSEYMSGHDALSMRPKPPGAASLSSTAKRKQRDAAKSPSEVEESDSAADAVTRCGPALRPTPAKRRRAAQVHNLSERRRRDRINEKMKALQELVPHCNKTDRASMLDEAIEYLKSLQLQLAADDVDDRRRHGACAGDVPSERRPPVHEFQDAAIQDTKLS